MKEFFLLQDPQLFEACRNLPNIKEERGFFAVERILLKRQKKVSVSSYILFKIGIHRVDSLKFGFNKKDYLK